MNKSSNGKYRTFIKDGQKYLKTRYDLLRLELLEKMSSIVSLLILIMLGVVLLCTVWVYVSCILVILMERVFGSFIPALLIMCGISLLALLIIVLLRDHMILNPLIRRFSKIIFNNPVDDDDEDDDNEDNDLNKDLYEKDQGL